jgi:hypothetical protein
MLCYDVRVVMIYLLQLEVACPYIWRATAASATALLHPALLVCSLGLHWCCANSSV